MKVPILPCLVLYFCSLFSFAALPEPFHESTKDYKFIKLNLPEEMKDRLKSEMQEHGKSLDEVSRNEDPDEEDVQVSLWALNQLRSSDELPNDWRSVRDWEGSDKDMYELYKYVLQNENNIPNDPFAVGVLYALYWNGQSSAAFKYWRVLNELLPLVDEAKNLCARISELENDKEELEKELTDVEIKLKIKLDRTALIAGAFGGDDDKLALRNKNEYLRRKQERIKKELEEKQNELDQCEGNIESLLSQDVNLAYDFTPIQQAVSDAASKSNKITVPDYIIDSVFFDLKKDGARFHSLINDIWESRVGRVLLEGICKLNKEILETHKVQVLINLQRISSKTSTPSGINWHISPSLKKRAGEILLEDKVADVNTIIWPLYLKKQHDRGCLAKINNELILYKINVPEYIVLGHELTHALLRLTFMGKDNTIMARDMAEKNIDLFEITGYKFKSYYDAWVKANILNESPKCLLKTKKKEKGNEFTAAFRNYWQENDEFPVILGILPEVSCTNGPIGERLFLEEKDQTTIVPWSHSPWDSLVSTICSAINSSDPQSHYSIAEIEEIVLGYTGINAIPEFESLGLNEKTLICNSSGQIFESEAFTKKKSIIGTPPILSNIYKTIDFGAYATKDVISDGNCGIWSVLQVLNPNESYMEPNKDQLLAMQKLRESAAQYLPIGVENSQLPKVGGWIEIADYEYIAQVVGAILVIVNENDNWSYEIFDADVAQSACRPIDEGQKGVEGVLKEYPGAIKIYFENTDSQSEAVRHVQAILQK